MSNVSEQMQEPQQFVVFHLGGEEYALPIAQIQEVIRYTAPRSVASEDAWVIGVISLRGKIVPVGDLAGRLGISATGTEESKIVIVETGAQTVGLVVDAVDEVLTIEADQLDTTSIADRAVVSGIAKVDQRLVVILDAEALTAGMAVAA
jgi:purine-binding chemotaxis protein CheW